jgi:hypothetical protein
VLPSERVFYTDPCPLGCSLRLCPFRRVAKMRGLGPPRNASPFPGQGSPSIRPIPLAKSEMALKGLSAYACQCLLIGHDQTCRGRALTAEFDPERTSPNLP